MRFSGSQRRQRRLDLFTKPSQQLRWKLALSYAAVTVLALVTVEILFFAVIGIAATVLLNSGVIPRQLIQHASTDYSPSLQPYLSESPPNLRGIAEVLARAEAITARTIPLSFEVRKFLVVGADHVLFGSSPQDLLGKDSIGRTLELEKLPELAGPLQAALSGEKNIDKLYVVGGPGRTVVLAVPVWDAEHHRVLGAMVGLAETPTAVGLVGEAAPIVGSSLLLFTVVAGIAGVAYGLLAARGPVKRLRRLAAASEAWGRGDFSALAHDSEADELGELARRLNQMAGRLEQLFELRQELAVLKERNRLARELHDSAKQLAFATAAQIGTARTLIARDPEEATSHIEEAEQLTHELRQELSSLILELAPPALEEKGLVTALREYSQSWSRHNNIEARMSVQGERRLPLSVSETVFRIVQEALANAARHSSAKRVNVDLTYHGNTIRCMVEDDGVGFDLKNIQHGFGLHSMADRASALNGELRIESEAGEGTRVTVRLPLDESHAEIEGELDG